MDLSKFNLTDIALNVYNLLLSWLSTASTGSDISPVSLIELIA